MFKLIDAAAEDASFLYELFATAKQEEMEAWNWPAAEQDEFVRMQHRAQQQSYSTRYPNAYDQIILCEGKKAGRMLTARSSTEVVVIDLVLLPAFRNRGVGTALLRELQQSLRAERLPLCLHVMVNSPARRLYARLGFSEDGFSIPFIRMCWRP